MDRNTFWSHTAPSYELIESGNSNSNCNVHSLRGEERSPQLFNSISTTYYHIEASSTDDRPLVTVRVFHTVDVDHEDRRERKFKLFNKK